MKRRLLATFLSLCLLVGLLPTVALATDEELGGNPSPVCSCEVLCTAEAVNAACPVCRLDYTACAYTVSMESEEESIRKPAEEPELPLTDLTPAEPVKEESAAANSLSDSGMLSTPDDLTAAVSAGGSYTLANDIVLEEKPDTPDAQATFNVSFTINADITIDLNGHSIYGNTQDTVIKVPSETTLTIKDSTATHEEGLANGTPGTVKNADGSYTVTYAVYDEEDNLTYNTYTAGAIVGGVKNHNTGGAIRAIHIDSGTVNFENGIITGTGVYIKNAAPSAIGILMAGGAKLNMSGGAISDNWARTDNSDEGSVAGIGVQLNSSDCTMKVTGGIFANNIAYGALNAQGAAINNQSGNVEISNAVFSGNQSLSDQRAFNGAINSSGTGSLTLENCIFVNNTATENAGEGYGGAISISVGSIKNCLFSHNSAKSAGGICVVNADTGKVTFEDVLIQHNIGGGLTYRDENHIDMQGATVMDNEGGDVSHTYGNQTDVFSVYHGFRFVGNGGKCTGSANLGGITVPVLEKEGCIFAGWYNDKDYTSEQVSTPEQNTIYYAKWVREITFNANGGEGTMNAQQVTEGDTSTTLTQNSFSKTGYTFAGWNTAEDGSGDSYTDQATAPTTSTTLYAQWTPNTYTIQFNGGEETSGSTANMTATYDRPATLTANGFTKDGYNFAGWDTDSSADEVVYSDGAQVENLTETANSTVTLYAVWTTKTVLAPDVSTQTRTYNGAEQTFTLEGNYTITYQQDGQAATPKDAGTYDLVISATETETTAAYENTVYGGLIINSAPLTITVLDKRVSVGSVVPSLENPVEGTDYIVSGLCGNDTLGTTPTLAYETTPSTGTAGAYTIKASGAGAGDNYTITYQNGTLTVYSNGGGGGGSSSGGSSSSNVSGSGDDVSISASGGSVTASQMESAVNKADGGAAITIKATGSSNISLPASGLESAADNDNSLILDLRYGEVTLSPEALSSVANQAGSTVTLTVTPVDTDELNSRQQAAVGDAPVFDLTIRSGSTVISDFDGGLVTVSIPYELPSNQDPAGVVVWFMDDNGNITPCETMYDTRTETVIFTTRHFSKYVIGYEEPTVFTDVSKDAYYADAVLWAVANGVTNGTSATTFSPDMAVSRAQMVTFLWRAHGSPEATGTNPFTDVSTSDYYYDAVLWAVANGVTNGTGATTFSPDMAVTRAQAVTFQWRAAGSPVVSGSSFDDVAADAYYGNAVTWAVANGITNGTSATTFSPDVVVSRAQAVTFLYREQE